MNNLFEEFAFYDSVEPAGVELPQTPVDKKVLDKLELEQGSSNYQIVRKLCYQGMVSRGLEKNKEYIDRVKFELTTLHDLGFIDYILLNWDVINFCHDNDIPVGGGRGCFLKDHEVQMADKTIKNIQDIKVGDYVLDHNNKKQMVLGLPRYDIEEEIVELTLENGRIISCTQDHKFFTENRGWVEAKNLTENDEIREISRTP